MTSDAVALLQQSIGKIVRITCTDGEVIAARITLVDALHSAFSYDC
jgi:small nuclear ribonucleoprotein (snRNP)-like protein